MQLINILRDEQPSHLAVAFDVGRKTFRSEIFAEYKANRAESPTDFRGQVSLVQEVLGALRVPVITAEGYEADDVIATLTVQAVEQGVHRFGIGQGFQRRVMLPRTVLLDALKRVGLLAADKTRPVRFSFEENALVLSTQNVDIGESREEVPVEMEGDSVELGFNHRYFQDVLSVLNEDRIVVELGDSLSPAIIRVPDEQDGLFVVMPMRLE